MKCFLISGLCILLQYCCFSQQFSKVGDGFPTAGAGVRALYADTVCNCVYAGGNNLLDGSNSFLSHLARWDGVKWDTASQDFWGHIESIVDFNNELYVGGNVQGLLPASSQFVAKKLSTDSLVPFAQPISHVALVRKVNNDLFINGWADTIAGIPVQGMIKYDGTNWTTLPKIYPNLTATSGFICVTVVESYNGMLYAGGNWSDGTSTMDDLAMLDTITHTWVPVGTPLSGQYTGINDMVVYKGELYIAGNICTCYGDPANGIMKWNGSQLLPVGTGTMPGYAGVSKMHVFDDKLWAVGEFIGMGSQPAQYVAYWDSVQWHGINGVFDNVVGVVTSLNNELYFGGGFWTVNNDSVHKIVKYSPYVGIDDLEQEKNPVLLYPNPATNNLNISYPKSSKTQQLYLFDLSGRTILKKELALNSTEDQLNLEEIPAGVYLTELVENTVHFGIKKLIIIK